MADKGPAGPDDGTDPGHSGPEPEPDTHWFVRPEGDQCDARPSPRRFAQTAYFHTARPPTWLGEDGQLLPVSRGVFLLGGLEGVLDDAPDPGDHTGTGPLFHTGIGPEDEELHPVLTDLWVYDLHNDRPCPWLPVTEDAGLAAWAGVLVHDDLRHELLLVGGERERGAVREATTELWSMPLDGGAVGGPPATFRPTPDGETLPPETLKFEVEGDPYCGATESTCPADGETVDFDVCSGSPSTDFSGDCEELNDDYDTAGCLVDPYCTVRDDTESRDFPANGVAHAASLFDEGRQVLRVFGGTEGIAGEAHVANEFLRIEDFPERTDQDGGVLHAANLQRELTLSLGPPGVPIEVTSERTAFSDHAEVVALEEFPENTSAGLRDASAVWLGRRFDRRTLRWAAHDGELLVLGGTRHQGFYPQVQHDPTPSGCDADHPCDVAEPGPGVEGSEVPSPWSTHGLVPPNWLLKPDGSTEDDPAWASRVSGRFAAAVIALEPRAVAVVGGIDAANTTGSASIVVVDQAYDEVVTEVAGAFPARYGASAVFDPVTRQGWIFGGSDTDDAVWTVGSANTIDPNVGSTWEMNDVELSLVRDGDVWHVEEAFRAVPTAKPRCSHPATARSTRPRRTIASRTS